MHAATPLVAALEKSDPQVLRQWAAEDFAIAIGLLHECPYHGQPFKARRRGATHKGLVGDLVDPLDPNVQIFNGDTRELLAAAERVARTYGERCVFCAASDQDEEDFD